MSVSKVGRLRNKVTFKTTTLSEDSYGGFTKANNNFFTAFAEIKPKVAQDRVQGDQQVSPQRFEVLIRYRSGITTTMRILFGSRTFNIVKINDENDYNNFITITAIENVGT